MKVESGIPFAGFYGSIWDGEIDRCEDMAIENLAEDWDGVDGVDGFEALQEEGELWEVLSANTDYQSMREQIAEAYVELFADALNEEFGFGVGLMFKELNSPREYNFTTDRILVEVELADVMKVYRKVGRKAVAKIARTMFTSYSGFISFYNPDIKTWGSLREWDYNQLLTIFAAAASRIDSSEYLDAGCLREEISNIYDNNVDWRKVEKDLQHKLDEKNGEAESDARKFPPSNIIDPKAYAIKYAELNHLKG